MKRIGITIYESQDATQATRLEFAVVSSEAVISALVDRFLAWQLPETVASDACVTNRDYPHPRYGTSLLTAIEARQMFEHALAAPLPTVPGHGSDAALAHPGSGVIERSKVFELSEGTELRVREVKVEA